jgi:hypothetical protein
MSVPHTWIDHLYRVVKNTFMLCAVSLAVIVSSVAQDTAPSTTIDWASRTTGQQVCVQPGANSADVKLKLINPNVILYSYKLDVKSHPLPVDDGKFLSALASTTKALTSQITCEEFDKAVDRIWKSRLFPKDRESVPLEDTRSDLATFKREIDLVTQGVPDHCSAKYPAATQAELAYLPVYTRVAANLEKAGSAEVDFSYSVDNKHWTQFHLRERTRFSNKETNASLSWKCGLDDVLTLSVGTLLTTLPYRTYDHQSVPTANGVQDQLVVNGSGSLTPIGVALLNYKLWTWDHDPQIGLSISTGPAIKLGGSVQASSLGWFAGPSISIWRRFFISPGMQIGQFADFPRGFQNGSVIPPNFGNLTPVTRWTTRFAIGLTFQTNSFVKSDQSTPTTSSTQPKSQSAKKPN